MFKVLLALLVLNIAVRCDTEFDRQMEKLENSKFGSTLLQTIFMQLQTEDPVANLIDMMQNLDNQIDAEQRREDDRQGRLDRNCNTDLEQLDQSISQGTITSLTLKSDLDQLNPQKTQAVASLNRKEAELEDLKGELQYQTEKRDGEKVQYDRILDELEQTLFGVGQIKGYFNKYLDGLVKDRRKYDKPEPQAQSFLEGRFEESSDEEEFDDESFEGRHKALTSLSQVASKINKIKHHVKLEGYKTLFQILSQLSVQANSKIEGPAEAEILTRKVISIIKQIEGYIQATRSMEDRAEEQRLQAFVELKQLYADQIVQANQDRTYMEGLIESLSNQIQGASNEKFEVDQRVGQKQKERQDKSTECVLQKQEYDFQTSSRIQQKQALSTAVDLISSKLGQLKKSMMEKQGY